MAIRTTKTKVRRQEKRREASKLTIQELRRLLEPYNDDDNVNVVLNDEANHRTLQIWYQSLSTNFGRMRGKRLAISNAAAVKSIGRPHLQLNDSSLKRFRRWEENPQTFWSLATGDSPFKPEPRNSDETYRKFFTTSAIQLYNEYSTYKILWRFTTAAFYLHFRRWKPEAQHIRAAHIRDFLKFMGCNDFNDGVEALRTIIKAGQRRIEFCQLLASRGTGNSRFLERTSSEDAAGNAAKEEEHFKGALGILFYDNIPDSMYVLLFYTCIKANRHRFDADDGLFPRDRDAIIQHLHSVDITSPPTQYDTCHLANKLLDYQNSLVWPAEEDRARVFTRNEITVDRNQPQMSTAEAAGMLKSLAACEPAQKYHNVAQEQPTHEPSHTQPFVGIMAPFECRTGAPVLPDSRNDLSPRNASQTPYQTGISIDPNSATVHMLVDEYPTVYQAGVSMDPNSYDGLLPPTGAYPAVYQAGVSMDPNSYDGLLPPTGAYPTVYQAGVSVDPHSYDGLLPPTGAYPALYQAGIPMDPNTYTGLMP
ncbi:hypothetical protein MY10362_004766 [Beauveria mimosiformis]